MDRKSKIWQIVLLLLLIAAIVAIVLFNNRLKTSNTALSTAQEQLAEAEKSAADLQEQLDKAQASYDEISTQAQADAETADSQIKDLQDKLTAAETEAQASADKIQELETAVSDSAVTIESLNQQIAEHQAIVESLTQQTADNGAQPDEGADIGNAEAPDDVEDDKVEETANVAGDADATTQALIENTDALQDKIDDLINGEGEGSDADRQAELEALKAELNGYIEQLEAASTQYSEAEAQLEAADATLAEMQQKLTAAEESTEALSAELEEKRDTIAELTTQIEALNTQSEADADQLDQLNAQLVEATKEAEDMANALSESQADYEKQLAEVEAYKLSRDLTDGDALTSTTVHDTIDVAADGVTADWHYDNSAISARDVVLQLQLDGETLYTSDTLKPGESIDEITLDKALEAGQYEAIAVTSVYGDDGELQFTNRVPVTLNVQ